MVVSKEGRREIITELVLDQKSVHSGELATRFGVSLMTIHRDLDALADEGLLRRFHGGASTLRSPLYEPDVTYRLKMSLRAKREIAAAALALVRSGETVLLDDSTSALSLAQRLPAIAPVTVITSFLETINLLAGEHGVRLIGLGGQYSPTNRSFHGAGFVSALHELRADVMFGSSAAIDAGGVFHQQPDVVVTKHAMMASADRKVLLIDHTKVGQRAVHRLSALEAWDAIVVDSQTDAAQVSALRDAGANVIVAPALP
jgi:DeoR/GlpR family transcriptional regulator of sugar metabolism